MSTILSKFAESAKKFHPVSATIELTERCNGSCAFCFLGTGHGSNRENHLKKEELYSVIDILNQNGILDITLTGGEPFIREDILDIFSYIKKKDFFKIHVKTNGTLIKQEHIDFIIKNKNYFGVFEFSVFSHIPEINDSYMGISGALRKILTVAEKLKKSGVTIHFAINLIKENIKTCWDTKEFLGEIGSKVLIGVTKLIPDNIIKKEVEDITSVDFFREVLKNIPENKLRAKVAGMLEVIKRNEKIGDDMCIGRSKGIMIDCMGDIHPCIAFRHFTVGNILKSLKPLPEMLKSSDMYCNIHSKRKSDIASCKNCRFFNFCNPCLGMMHTQHGNLDIANECLCNYTQALYSFAANFKDIYIPDGEENLHYASYSGNSDANTKRTTQLCR